MTSRIRIGCMAWKGSLSCLHGTTFLEPVVESAYKPDCNPDSSVHLYYVVPSPDSNPLPVVVLCKRGFWTWSVWELLICLLVNHTGGSDTGPSEKKMTSLQRTLLQVPVSCVLNLLQDKAEAVSPKCPLFVITLIIMRLACTFCTIWFPPSICSTVDSYSAHSRGLFRLVKFSD